MIALVTDGDSGGRKVKGAGCEFLRLPQRADRPDCGGTAQRGAALTHIVILTGAGISAESGLPTFRDPQGIWARHDPLDLATPAAFARDPALVHRFYNDRRAAARAAAPNAAHLALARLQGEFTGRVDLVTQNVDDLHERAGAGGVIHLHGRLDGARCVRCAARWVAPLRMTVADRCPACAAPARPAIVWFGETPEHLEQVADLCRAADRLVVIGSSGTVWPAAGLVDLARQGGAATLEINTVPSARAAVFDSALIGPATRVVPDWVDGLLAEPFRL